MLVNVPFVRPLGLQTDMFREGRDRHGRPRASARYCGRLEINVRLATLFVHLQIHFLIPHHSSKTVITALRSADESFLCLSRSLYIFHPVLVTTDTLQPLLNALGQSGHLHSDLKSLGVEFCLPFSGWCVLHLK